MKILPVSITNTNFKKGGLFSKVEGTAATIETKVNTNRKSIPIELHNALVKLTSWRTFALATAISGFGGYKITDTLADKDAEDFANAVNIADIDTTAPVEIKDLTNDGSADLILKKKDGSSLVLDLKNLSVLTEFSGLKEVE